MAETQDVRKGPVGPGLEQYAGLDGALECGLQRGGNHQRVLKQEGGGQVFVNAYPSGGLIEGGQGRRQGDQLGSMFVCLGCVTRC